MFLEVKLCFFQNEWTILIWIFGCKFLFGFIDTKYAIHDSCIPRENKMFVSLRGQSHRWRAPTIKTQHTHWSLNYLVIEKLKYGISNQLIKRTTCGPCESLRGLCLSPPFWNGITFSNFISTNISRLLTS